MGESSLLKDKFQHFDFLSISKLLESSYRLLNQNLELRDPLGKVIFSYPSIGSPIDNSLCFGETCQEWFHNGLKRGEIQRINTDKNQSLIGLPIMRNDHFMGALIISDHQGKCAGGLSEAQETETIKFYQCITDFIAKDYLAQLETLSLSEELAIRYEELNLFYKVGEWLKGVQETEASLQLIIENITDTLETDYGFITIPSKGVFAVSGSLEDWNEVNDKQGYLYKIGDELLKAFVDKELIVLDHVHEHQDLKSYFPPSLSLMAIPININGFRQGALAISFKRGVRRKKFKTGDVRLLHSMAEVISILFKNIELYQNLKSFLVMVVKCLVAAIEAKDIYTRGHSERVNYISLLIADSMELPSKVREGINWASMLHDIGKIGIPEAILTKADKLTEEEFAEIKKHPERGYIILKPIQGFQPALEGVHFHHERYDGKGYPAGLKGKEIPLNARVIAIADTYDAITSNRAYRNSLSHEEAIAEIKRVAGTQLDDYLVRVFLNLIDTKGPQILDQENIKQSKN